MKILIAVTSHLSYKLIQGQINFLRQNGNQVFFCSSFNNEVKLKVEKEGGAYLPIEMEREINPIKDIISLFKIVILLYKIKPDIINVSTPKAALLFSIASKFVFNFKMKTIFTLRGLRSDTLSGLKYKVVFFTEKLTCFLADRIIVIAPSLEKHAIEKKLFKKNKSTVILKGSSNGININKFKKVETDLRKKLNISNDTVVYGYVGRLVNDKGIRELFEAFQKLKKRYPNILLLLIGSYKEADCISVDLLNSIKNDNNIILLDHTDSIEEYYAIMDVFILFSYREGFGNVVIESGAMEIPAIVANIPGLKDTIVNNETGFLVNAKDSIDLAKKMEIFYNDRVLISQFGKNSRMRIERYFTNEKIWNGQLEIYKKTLN